MDDAKRAGLVKKDGWQFYPKAMLRARAITAGLRAVAPDIIAGIYDPEELGADVTVDGEIVIPPAAPHSPALTAIRTEIEDLKAEVQALDTAREDLEARLQERRAAPVVPRHIEVPPDPGFAPAPYEEWKAAIQHATVGSLKPLWAGCSKKEVWESSPSISRPT